MTNEASNQPPISAAPPPHERLIDDVRLHTRRALAHVGQRVARSLAGRFGAPGRAGPGGLADAAPDALLAAVQFAEQFATELPPATGPAPAVHPLIRLAAMPRSPATAALLNELVHRR